MSDNLLTNVEFDSSERTNAEYELVASKLLSQITNLEEQMEKDHVESERLKAETKIIKAHTEATLSRLREQINRLSRTV